MKKKCLFPIHKCLKWFLIQLQNQIHICIIIKICIVAGDIYEQGEYFRQHLLKTVTGICQFVNVIIQFVMRVSLIHFIFLCQLLENLPD